MKVTPLTPQFRDSEPVRFEVTRTDKERAQEFTWSLTSKESPPVALDAKLRDGKVRFGNDDVFEISFGTLHPGVYEFVIRNKAGNAVSSDGFVVGDPHVTRVELVKPGANTPLKIVDPCATYEGFSAYLTDLLKQPNISEAEQLQFGAKQVDKAGKPAVPPFGKGGVEYEHLMMAARAYTTSCNCHDLLDFAPENGKYLEDRALATVPGWAKGTRIDLPCIELIWNYWQEEGMLAQTLNHVVARFQNRRVSVGDPLARFDVSPLLPLRSLMWSWVENEQRRLTVRRRAAEYEFEYGLTLIGRAVPAPGSYVERRSNFLSAFHTILHLATVFYKELDDLTINADGFPLYEALRQCHLVLSQGTQNQYGEMAVAARSEMLVMQHILAQPSMREFLGGRPMTPYPEPWMDRVDAMKAIQSWNDTSVIHFHDLATFGERLVLTIRLGNWNAATVSGPDAANWATAFRQHIQRYIAAYRAVTGVDLAMGVETTMPSTLISARTQDTRARA
jgi:hypothetical protein